MIKSTAARIILSSKSKLGELRLGITPFVEDSTSLIIWKRNSGIDDRNLIDHST